ncbi:unnamed protein product [Urochloa humidicola]
MHLARAYERRAATTASPPALPVGAACASTCPDRGRHTIAAASATRRDGTATTATSVSPSNSCGDGGTSAHLCFNCDEPYVRGHQCQRLFYLEVTDYLEDEAHEAVPEDTAGDGTGELALTLNAIAGSRTAGVRRADDPTISLNAIVGICTADTM